MMDKKYGRVFTEDDVKMIVAAAIKADDPSTVDLDPIISQLSGYGFELRFQDGEPIFVVRGKDKAALATVMHYRERALIEGAKEPHHQAVLTAIGEFKIFAEGNPQLMKVPD